MLRRLLDLPFPVILLGIGAVSMYVPAAHAAAIENFPVMRAFFNSANLLLVFTALIGLATANREPRNPARGYLLALVGTYAALPLVLAVPLAISAPGTGLLNAWFEMVSSITTTGATVFDDPSRVPDPVHLWRGLVGWLGGFFAWVTAFALLAPMNLGGFEVLGGEPETSVPVPDQSRTDPARGAVRLQRYAARLFPLYAGLTVLLWVSLFLSGDRPLVAIIHAMSTLSTSGISPVGGLSGSHSGVAGEAIMFVFLFFALSRHMFSGDAQGGGVRGLGRDPEFLTGILFVLGVSLVLFLRHWVGALGEAGQSNLAAALRAAWGSVFTVMSFLTTTGFESIDWEAARDWSGLPAPGTILIGMALMGGGIATTAGGVKLLRVYALYKHGLREMERLVHPSSVGGAGIRARRLRHQGAYMAWIFFMLFALSVTVVTVLLSLVGVPFEPATILASASLSTTGPLAVAGATTPISYATLGEAAKIILAGAMVLGRLETLALIALLNPDFWRQ